MNIGQRVLSVINSVLLHLLGFIDTVSLGVNTDCDRNRLRAFSVIAKNLYFTVGVCYTIAIMSTI